MTGVVNVTGIYGGIYLVFGGHDMGILWAEFNVLSGQEKGEFLVYSAPLLRFVFFSIRFQVFLFVSFAGVFRDEFFRH